MTESLLQQARELRDYWRRYEREFTYEIAQKHTAFLDAAIEHLEQRPLIVHRRESRDASIEFSNLREYDRILIVELMIRAISTNDRGIAEEIASAVDRIQQARVENRKV